MFVSIYVTKILRFCVENQKERNEWNSSNEHPHIQRQGKNIVQIWLSLNQIIITSDSDQITNTTKLKKERKDMVDSDDHWFGHQTKIIIKTKKDPFGIFGLSVYFIIIIIMIIIVVLMNLMATSGLVIWCLI